MAKRLELSKHDAVDRLSLFLSRRKGKEITEQTVKDFGKLLEQMDDNFKSSVYNIIHPSKIQENINKELALNAIKHQFIEFESGGNCRLSNIEDFSFYGDGKYKARIGKELREITERDFKVLRLIFT